MKTIIKLISIVVFIFGFSFQQKTNSHYAPDAVQRHLKSIRAKMTRWEVDSHGNNESHFKIDGTKYRADFKPNGTIIN